MSNYFRDFPKVDYRFGDNELPVKFQHIGTYVDILDQVKQYNVFYETYSIQNGERPDALSYKLYESSDYYWTFYLLNHNLRDHGWPLRDAEVWPMAQKYYPNMCFTTTAVTQEKNLKLINIVDGEDIIEWIPTDQQTPLCKSKNFKVGNWVWFRYSKTVGKILRIDQELGMLHIDVEGYRKLDNIMEVISEADAKEVMQDPDYIPNIRIEEIEIVNYYDQFDAPHHYEDAEGNWIYPSYGETYPYIMNQRSVRSFSSVSYYQRLFDLNEENKTISVIKPESIQTVIGEFNKLLKQ